MGADEKASFWARYKTGLIVFGIGAILVFFAASAMQPVVSLDSFGRVVQNSNAALWMQLGAAVLTGVIAFAAGFLPLWFMKKRPDVAVALAALVLLFLLLLPAIGWGMIALLGVLAFGLGIAFAMGRSKLPSLPDTFGSAKWADRKELIEVGLIAGGDNPAQPHGFRLGAFNDGVMDDLVYSGDRHLLTVAPTRGGKGVSAIIPNLLTYQGSVLCIDPKGENALITAGARHDLGQHIVLLDPWDLAASSLSMTPSRFNPLDWLVADDPDIAENAMLLADALVVSSGGGERFWDEEAKALLMGIILYVATDEGEREHRHLGRVRDWLCGDSAQMTELFAAMALSQNPIVRSTGTRTLQKDEKTLANVLASTQAQTHFLDSPRIRESLSASDIGFEELKTGAVSIYLILPADRLNAFGRWMRLLIQQAITINARNIDVQPEHPILFLLDEMPALGQLKMVEQAYGLMAGFGMQLWGIVQDLSQLERIYGKGWQTFVSNSGVLQYFGSRDQMTAEYFSKLAGVATVWNISTAISTALNGGGDNGNQTKTSSNAQRPLAFPDELMTMRKESQLLLVGNHNPIMGQKTPWYETPILKDRGVNLHAD